MTITRLCPCGKATPQGGRCAQCERQRNNTPHRKAHRTEAHYNLRSMVFARDNHTCVDCGRTQDLTLDYLRPLQDGGTMTSGNAMTRCRRCNSREGRRT